MDIEYFLTENKRNEFMMTMSIVNVDNNDNINGSLWVAKYEHDDP